jgi:hypothetical protein
MEEEKYGGGEMEEGRWRRGDGGETVWGSMRTV